MDRHYRNNILNFNNFNNLIRKFIMKLIFVISSLTFTALNCVVYSPNASAYEVALGVHTGIQHSAHHITNNEKTAFGSEFKNMYGSKFSSLIGVSAGIQFKATSLWTLGMDTEFSYSPNKVEEYSASTPAAGNAQRFRPFKTNFKRNFAFGLGIKAGYSLNKVVPYARLGIEYTRFNHTFQGQIALPLVDQVNASRNFHAWGIVPGVGMDIPLTTDGRVLMNVETRYAFYSSKTIQGVSQSNLTGTSTVKPRFINLNLGIKFIV